MKEPEKTMNYRPLTSYEQGKLEKEREKLEKKRLEALSDQLKTIHKGDYDSLCNDLAGMIFRGENPFMTVNMGDLLKIKDGVKVFQGEIAPGKFQDVILASFDNWDSWVFLDKSSLSEKISFLLRYSQLPEDHPYKSLNVLYPLWAQKTADKLIELLRVDGRPEDYRGCNKINSFREGLKHGK